MRKYNPGFLTDDEIVASFCVRETEFELLVDALRECTGSANQHQLVIGPRGSGKTSLLLRVAAEVRRDAELASRCLPIVFAEESYEVATAGEFWLECLSHLAGQAPRRDDDPDLQRTVDELRASRDDQLLADRCLGALLDFADRQDKRLLLIVENLNTLFRDMSDHDAGWKLRKILQTEPRIILFASATSHFEEIDNPDRALYDLFQVRKLRPLDTEQCSVLWETVAGRQPARPTVRSLQILTGGNPRLVAIVAHFGAGLSFRELMADLLDLVDNHTEYFRSHLESLPAQERRVYLALATLWKPATTREIAEQARLDTNKCSAQLTRLGERGVVQIAGGSARRKQYYLTERLYNIYYLLRRRRGPDLLVEALVHFMESYYSPTELKSIATRLADDAQRVGQPHQLLYRSTLARLIQLPALAEYRGELLRHVSQDLAQTIEFGVKLQAANDLIDEAQALIDADRSEELLTVYDEMISRFSDTRFFELFVATVLVSKASVLHELNRREEAVVVYGETTSRFDASETTDLMEPVAVAFTRKSALLMELDRPEDALIACDELLSRFNEDVPPALLKHIARGLANKGVLFFLLGRFDEAVAVSDEVVHRFGEAHTAEFSQLVVAALSTKVAALALLDRLDVALAVCDETLHRFRTDPRPSVIEAVASLLAIKASLLCLSNPDEALATYEEAIRRLEEVASASASQTLQMSLLQKGRIERNGQRYEAAIATSDRLFVQCGDSYEYRWRAHLARSMACLGMAGPSACVPDIEATLAILPELDNLPPECLETLTALSVEIGPKRMLELIQASPSATLLAPLATALEEELGLQPRVAREIEEVAQDIRADLSELRAQRADAGE